MEPHPAIGAAERYSWTVHLANSEVFPKPVALSRDLRAQLDAFAKREAVDQWGWFVQFTHTVSEHDFGLLTAWGEGTDATLRTGKTRQLR